MSLLKIKSLPVKTGKDGFCGERIHAKFTRPALTIMIAKEKMTLAGQKHTVSIQTEEIKMKQKKIVLIVVLTLYPASGNALIFKKQTIKTELI
jgi:hypothetical protein